MKKLALFDLDGVILDSRENMRLAWSAVQSHTGTEIPFESYFQNIGRPIQDIFKIIGAKGDYNEMERIYQEASLQYLAEAQFYTGAKSMLKILTNEGFKLGIVTSKDRKRTKVVLDQLDVVFNVVLSPCSGFRGKPAPDYLLLAMAKARVDPDEAIYVGDMETDCSAAMRAKIDYLHAAWGYGMPPAGNHLVANSIESLPDILMTLNNEGA